VKPAPRHRKVVSVNCAYCSGGSLFEVRDNLIRLEVWCYFVQFLYNRLDKQECMRRNLVLFLVYSYIHARQWTDICNTCVPYYRVSRIFMSRIFHPCNMVPHFHVPQVHVSHFQRPLANLQNIFDSQCRPTCDLMNSLNCMTDAMFSHCLVYTFMQEPVSQLDWNLQNLASHCDVQDASVLYQTGHVLISVVHTTHRKHGP